jgi:hypothetical protein
MHVLLMSALAAPLDDELGLGRPELVDLAWPHFAACTSAELTFEELRVQVVDDLGGYAGRTHPSPTRPTIELKPTARDELVLLHELAHLWTEWGPRALNEGLTETLAECVYRRLHDEPTFQTHKLGLEPGLGLLSWDSDDGLEPEAIQARYLSSYRLAKALEMLPPEQRWSREGYGWPELWALLDQQLDLGSGRYGRDEDGHPEIELPPSAMALFPLMVTLLPEMSGDVDGDGLDWGAELALQTEPFVWDSDGDGWWDGAQPPGGVFAPPRASSCLGIPSEDREVSFVAAGPEADKPYRWTVQAKAGLPVVIAATTLHQRIWLTLQGPPLRPCSDRPARAGTWPMDEVDPDRDGLVEALELEQGTDPARFDTDGDGWWDGAQPPAGATPYTGPGWRCVGLERREWGEPHQGGPDTDKVQARITREELGRFDLLGVQVEGPAQARVWFTLPEADKPCPPGATPAPRP